MRMLHGVCGPDVHCAMGEGHLGQTMQVSTCAERRRYYFNWLCLLRIQGLLCWA
jgi:hypothetical protein